jgi:hypothetical protein
MDIFQSRVVTLHCNNQVETRFTFLGECWKEERFHRDRLREDRGRLSLADVLAAIGYHQLPREEALRIDPRGAAALTPEDLLLKA